MDGWMDSYNQSRLSTLVLKIGCVWSEEEGGSTRNLFVFHSGSDVVHGDSEWGPMHFKCDRVRVNPSQLNILLPHKWHYLILECVFSAPFKAFFSKETCDFDATVTNVCENTKLSISPRPNNQHLHSLELYYPPWSTKTFFQKGFMDPKNRISWNTEWFMCACVTSWKSRLELRVT